MPFTRLRQSMIKPNGSITGSLSGTSSYSRRALTASYALNSSGGGGGGSVQTGSIAKQTVWTNVTSGSTNTITGLNLSSNKWDVSVVEEWDAKAIPGDQYYNSCSLLMHFNGANGSTTFTDNSKNNLTVTSNNGASISTAQSKFGGASVFFDGTDDYLSSVNNSAFNLSSGDFTVEFWFRTSTLSLPASHAVLVGQMSYTSAGWGIWQYSSTTVYVYIGTGFAIQTPSVFSSTSTWYHIALVKNGTGANSLKLYVDGVVQAQGNYTPTYASSYPLVIGGITTTTGWNNNFYSNGYIDELRITKGVARYTSNFTPPNSQFYNNQSTYQSLTKYIGTVGGLNDANVDYGVQKLSDSSLKVVKMTVPSNPPSGSLSASIDRVYVNVLDYTNVSVTSSYSLLSKTASYALNSSGGGGGGSVQTGSIAKQTVWTNVTSGSTNTITSLNLSSNKWDVSVVEEWDAATLDQYYNSCSLLCHFDKLNSSGSFIDNSRNNLTITSVNGATISNVQSKFGGASALFDGTNDYLTIADTVPLRLGSTAYTIEAWIYLNSLPNPGPWSIFQQNQHIGAGNFLELIVYFSGGSYYLEANLYNSSVYKYSVTKTVTNLLNVWHHVALIWTGTTAYVSFDGVLSTGVSYSGNDAPSTPTTYIGLYYAATSYYFNGYIDELRVTKGVARYTSNFRPPPLPFPNSRNQVLTRYVGLVGGIDDKYVDYGVEKLSNSSLKLTRLTYPNQPLIGSGSLSGSVSRVYVNVLDYTNVSVTSSYARNSLSASYLIPTSNNTTKAIFGYGYTSAAVSMTNLVNNTGVVANDVTGVGSARHTLAATGYGVDKAIFGYGYTSALVSITNLVSNTGVVATDTTGVGTARDTLAATGYGADKAIFGYGNTGANVSMTNLISNTGVVATDTTGVGTARSQIAAAGY